MRSTYLGGAVSSRSERGGGEKFSKGNVAGATADNCFARWHVVPPAESGLDGWLLSYLDLITLLLSILVVMLAVARLHPEPLDAVRDTVATSPVTLVGSLALDRVSSPEKSAFVRAMTRVENDALPSLNKLVATAAGDDSAESRAASQNADATHAPAVTASVMEVETPQAVMTVPSQPLPSANDLGLNDLGSAVDVIINEQSVSFRISDDLLFASGQATLSDPGHDVLRRLAVVLNRNEHPVSVEGHSDSVGIRNKQFSSNWELSSGRATSVLRQLARNGVKPGRLRAIGYAQTRPLESNDTPAGRAANRRVELVMEIKPSPTAHK
jgi:chemotaxis protein MotB